MIRLRQAIIVEGRYDKIKLSGFIDGLIVETGGFRIFRDRETLDYIRSLAKDPGIVVLTDSDAAGFQIRAKLTQVIPAAQIRHAYIPDVFGKERRKSVPSGEGKLGVEGMTEAVLVRCLQEAGATFLPEAHEGPPAEGDRETEGPEGITQGDLYQLGLVGRPDSRTCREGVLKALGLPRRMSAKMLGRTLNARYDREEALALLLRSCEASREV